MSDLEALVNETANAMYAAAVAFHEGAVAGRGATAWPDAEVKSNLANFAARVEVWLSEQEADDPTLHPCVACGDRIKPGYEEPSTIDPDASPICRNCAWPDLLDAKRAVDATVARLQAELERAKDRENSKSARVAKEG